MSGSGGFDTSQVSVGTAATQLCKRRPGRVAVTITSVGGSEAVYIGDNASVATSNGAYIPAADGGSLTIPTQAEVWAIVGSSTQEVSVTESY